MILKKLKQFNFLLNNSKRIIKLQQDAISNQRISWLLNGYPQLPLTEKSARPFLLNLIINEIIINNRKSIIEFGSGISTIIIARLINNTNNNIIFTSIEHDKDWFNFISDKLKTENLLDKVNLIYAPLQKVSLDNINSEWYQTNVIIKELQDKKFDLIVIDGPPAYEEHNIYSRSYTLKYLEDKLMESCAIILDDASRKGEKYAVDKWQKDYGIQFKIVGESVAIAYKGNYFISTPFI